MAASGLGASSHSPKRAKTEFGEARTYGRFTVVTSSKTVRALIVEDDDALRRTQKMIIEGLDVPVRVEEAANGREAIDMNHARPFNVIFMDLDMPVMNGVEATRALRDMGSRSTIIGMISATAVNNDQLVREFQDVVDECCSLPISTNDYRSILGRVWNEI